MSKNATKTPVVTPLGDRVIGRRIEARKKSEGGILLPDNAEVKKFEATVIAVGPGKLRDDGTRNPMPVKVGDRVLYGSYQDHEVDIDGEKFVVIEEANLLAKIG